MEYVGPVSTLPLHLTDATSSRPRWRWWAGFGLLLLLAAGAAFLLWQARDGRGPTVPHTTARGALPPANPPASAGSSSRTAQTSSLARAELLRKAISLIEELYLEPGALKPGEMFTAAIESIARAAPDALWTPPAGTVPGALMVGRRVLLLEPDRLKTLKEMGTQLEAVFAFYLQSREIETEDAQIEYAAIRGLCSRLDRPSRLLIDDRLDDFRIRTRGTLEGIGCRLSMRQDEPTVLEVIEGGPAAGAGIKEGDRVIRVEGESTVNMSLSDVISRLRGQAGSWVSVDMVRGEERQPLTFRLLRERIKLENVQAYRLPDDIGYVRITNFNEETLSNFRTRLDRVAPQGTGLKGLVLDLRGNGGGSLRQSAYMVDEFVASGLIVRTEGRGEGAVRDLLREISAQPAQLLSGAPLAVLVDGETASGAEILAGALKYLDRAVLVGQRTYGKGSVQKVYGLSERASLKLTVARYILPGEHLIQSIGIQPDIALMPVVVAEDNVRLAPPQPVSEDDDGEGGAGVSSDAAPDAPTTRLSYLRKARPEGETDRVKLLWSDFEVRFAAQLLAATPVASRQALLTESRRFVEKARRDQSQELQGALKARGVDWSPGPLEAEPELEVALRQEPSARPLRPGEEATLSVQVVNRGGQVLRRLWAISDSDDRVLDKLEFLFGRVPAGGERAWPVKVKVPAGAAPGMRVITLHFFSDGQQLRKPFRVAVSVEPAPPPFLEAEITYQEEGLSGTADHQNRVIEPGERAVVRVVVRNSGAGASGQVNVSLLPPGRKELELQTGKVVLESIAPGEQRVATLSFDAHAAEASAPPLSPVVKLLVADRAHRISLVKELQFGQPWTGLLRMVPPRVELTSDIPLQALTSSHLVLSGQVSSPQGIRQLTFFRGRQKVQRLLPELQADRPVTLLPFQADIPLQPGANWLEVLCEDESGLVSQRQLWVRVEPS